MLALALKFPSTTKSCGTFTTRQALSSVPGRQRGSVQSVPGGGGGGCTWRPRLCQPCDGWHPPASVPVQQPPPEPPLSQGCPGAQYWYTSHAASAQQLSMQAPTEPSACAWCSRPMHCWPS